MSYTLHADTTDANYPTLYLTYGSETEHITACYDCQKTVDQITSEHTIGGSQTTLERVSTLFGPRDVCAVCAVKRRNNPSERNYYDDLPEVNWSTSTTFEARDRTVITRDGEVYSIKNYADGWAIVRGLLVSIQGASTRDACRWLNDREARLVPVEAG